MNLSGVLNLNINSDVRHANKRPLSEVNSGKPIYAINSKGDMALNPYLIDQLFNYIIDGNEYDTLPLETERFINRFLYEAGKKTDDSSYELNNIMKLLDVYLGSIGDTIDTTEFYSTEESSEQDTYVIIPFSTIQGLFN